MNKNSAHFKLAAWSLKHPRLFWAYVGTSLLAIVLAVGIGSWLVSSPKRHSERSIRTENPVTNIGANEPVSDMWVQVDKSESAERRCVLYKNKISDVSMVTCYRKVNDQWVFSHSY